MLDSEGVTLDSEGVSIIKLRRLHVQFSAQRLSSGKLRGFVGIDRQRPSSGCTWELGKARRGAAYERFA